MPLPKAETQKWNSKTLSVPRLSEVTRKQSKIKLEKSYGRETDFINAPPVNFKVPVRTYQPTYRLNPKNKFSVEKVEKILKRLVEPELLEVEYNDKLIPELCMSLAELIRQAIKELNYDRYRIIVCVTMGQKRQQSVNLYHSFLWDHERDSFACHNYENCHIFANAVVYGVYLD